MEFEQSEPLRVEVVRGGRVESVHRVDVAVVEPAGDWVARAGAADEPVFARSAIKPFQALPLVVDGCADALGLTQEELALCCASHSSEPRHVELARSILDRADAGEEALACGPHAPFSSAAERALYAGGREPGRIHNNCSGKHAGMIALAHAHGWTTDGYHEFDHPVQRRIARELERWTGLDVSALPRGVDGCGVVTYALPLTALALAFARLAEAAGAGEGEPTPAARDEGDGKEEVRGAAAARVVGAMTGHPFAVGGSGRLCTEVMRHGEGRLLAKVGAEGVYAAASLDREWGIALKARDGARRAAETALVAVLDRLHLLGPAAEPLERWRKRAVPNTRGEVVGELRVVWEAE